MEKIAYYSKKKNCLESYQGSIITVVGAVGSIGRNVNTLTSFRAALAIPSPRSE